MVADGPSFVTCLPSLAMVGWQFLGLLESVENFAVDSLHFVADSPFGVVVQLPETGKSLIAIHSSSFGVEG